MEINSIWWIWIIIGVIFLFIELFTNTFFGLWMAIAALLPAAISLIKPEISVEIQIISWIIAMIVCGVLWVKFSKPDAPLQAMDDQLVGQIGVLAKSCDTENSGTVLLQKPVGGATQWQCIANQPIAADTRVVIKEQINATLVRVDYEKKS